VGGVTNNTAAIGSVYNVYLPLKNAKRDITSTRAGLGGRKRACQRAVVARFRLRLLFPHALFRTGTAPRSTSLRISRCAGLRAFWRTRARARMRLHGKYPQATRFFCLQATLHSIPDVSTGRTCLFITC